MADSQFLDLETARELRKKLDTPPTVDRNPGIKAAIGKHGGVSWMKELLQALRAPGKLTIDEYFYYRLYDLPRDEMLRFVGKKAQAKMHSACNNVQWFALCHDKAVFYTALHGAGMPVPETIAVHEPRGRAGCFEVLRDEEQLHGFFSDPSNYPLFAKPVDGIYSIGAFHLKEVVGNQIALADGTLSGWTM